jgi:P-aminobenzoate N-oxygenase AurF
MQAVGLLTRDLPQEEHEEVAREEAYQRLLARLSHQSVVKHFDAFADIPWEDPAFAIDHDDPRLALGSNDPLGATEWYRAQPAGVQSRIGLHMIATFARIGYSFESVLKRGLLEFATTLPVGAPEFRYAYHEVIEEAQHSLFFHEFVQRSRLDVRPPRVLGLAQHQVVRMGRSFPELFFMFVLSGEDPIDWAQRRILQSGRELHPLVERISRIHIIEEARHMSFARHYLRRAVPQLRGWKRLAMRVRTPLVFKIASQFMMRPSEHIVRTYGIPRPVLREAYGPGSLGARYTIDALGKPRELCWELGVLNSRSAWLWKALGIYAPRGA